MKLFLALLLSVLALIVLLLTVGQTAGASASPTDEIRSSRVGSTAGSLAAPSVCTGAYSYTVSTGTLAMSAHLLPGSQCTNCVVPLELPFPVSFYGQVYTATNVSNTGNLQFLTAATPEQSCPMPYAELGPSILPYWNSWLDTSWDYPCEQTYREPCGVFTILSGNSPFRTFEIEWRSRYLGSNTEVVDYAVIFYESSEDFDFVYGNGLMYGDPASVGVQDGTDQYTTYGCNVSEQYVFHKIHWTLIHPLPCEPTPTPTAMPTFTATPTASATSTPSQTSTPTATYTQILPTSTSTHTPIATASVTPTACAISFSDVPPGSTFYPYVQCLACLGIVEGYPDGTYRPNFSVTRGQAAKILANSAGFDDNIPPEQQTFADVPQESTFWLFIERVALHGAISGYPCGVPGEPCPGTYFRPQSTLTRGQAAKIVSVIAGFADTIPPERQTFSDVPPESTFWLFIERDVLHGVINGYLDGAFRPQNVMTRGQLAKIASLAFLPECTR